MRRAHAEAERIVAKTATGLHQFGADLDPTRHLISHSAREELRTKKRRGHRNLFESQPFTINETEWRGSKFFDSMHVGGRNFEYNMDHEFFDRINETFILEAEEDADPMLIATELKVLIDLLIVLF